MRFLKSAALCLVVLAFLVPLETLGQNRYRVNVIAISNGNTKIRISHVGIYSQLYGEELYECIGFANGSDRIVTAIRFRFTYVDAGRHISGFDTLERRGQFEPGAFEDVPTIVPGQSYERGALERLHNCQHFKYPNNDIAYLVATVDRVEFADGSVWEDVRPTATPTAPTSSPSPTPSATP